MTERLLKNLRDMEARKKYENELSEIDFAIRYHKTIVKYLKKYDIDEMKYHENMLNSLRNVRKNIDVKREQVRLALKKRGLDY